MSNTDEDDIKEYFSEHESDCVFDAQTTRFTDCTVIVDIKEEPQEIIEETNNVNGSKDHIKKSHEMFEFVPVSDHVFPCKQELHDVLISDFDAEAILKMEQDIEIKFSLYKTKDEEEYLESHIGSCVNVCSRKHLQSTSSDLHRRVNVEYARDRHEYKCNVETDLRRHVQEEHREDDKKFGSVRRQDGVEALGVSEEESSEHRQSCDFEGENTASSERHIGDLDRSSVVEKKERSFETNGKPMACKICHKSFSTRTYLETHILIHTGEKPYACHRCDFKCNQKGSLARHVRSHDGVKPCKCTICEKCFADNGQLKKHLDTHTRERPFACDYCEYKCGLKGNLKKHLRTHTGDKPYACNRCDYKCRERGNLAKHIDKHDGVKPFECTICNKSFGRSGNLKRHLLVHTGEKSFACHECEYSCNDKLSIVNHIKKVH